MFSKSKEFYTKKMLKVAYNGKRGKINWNMLKKYIDKGADIDGQDGNGNTVLIHCAYNKEIFEKLSELNVNLNVINNDGETALIRSVKRYNEETAYRLIDKGADVNVTDKNNRNALNYAFERKNGKLMELLLDNNSKVKGEDDFFMINFALSEGGKYLARKLVFNGLNLDVGTANVPNLKIKQTLLCKAAKWGDDELLNFLLNKGADVNRWDQFAVTPLMYASEKGHINAVKLLIKNGANVNENINQNSALKMAVKNNHQSIISLLKEYGS